MSKLGTKKDTLSPTSQTEKMPGATTSGSSRPSAPPAKKQAVVMVHGMGEQRPMDTLRSFVAALTGVQPVQEAGGGEVFHIIPDNAAGSNELARIRVAHPPRGAVEYDYEDQRIRTDFYEFYYADLLGGTTFSHLRVWAQGVMLRWPHQVPKALAGLWLTLWIVALGLVWWIGAEFDGNVWDNLTAFVTSGLKANAPQPTLLQLLLLILAAACLAWQLLQMAIAHADAMPTKPNPERTISSRWSVVSALAVPAVAGIAAYRVLPWAELNWSWPATCSAAVFSGYFCAFFSFINQPWIKLIAAASVWWAATRFGVAYFGDVARYLNMSPDAIASRAEIRDRGINLLSAIAAKRAIINGVPSENPEYARVVVVAHSLGSVIAFDLLRILWARDNANSNKALPAGALEEMEKILTLARTVEKQTDSGTAVSAEQCAELIDCQKNISASLASQSHGWRISDFVTLGSPLALADFLLARDWPRLMQLTLERSLPISPPLLEGRDNSFLYSGGIIPGVAPHHAAMFSSIRWTAFYDPYRYPMNGDFIGGPVTPLFGWGVTEAPVKIRRRRRWLAALFTHTDYWNPGVQAEFEDSAKLPKDLRAAGSSDQVILAALRRLIWPEKQS